MPLPGPTGNPVNFPILTGSKQHQIGQITNWLNQTASVRAGTEYAAYAEAHFSEGTPLELLSAFILTAQGRALGIATQAGLNAGADIANAIPSSIPKLNPANDLASFFSNLFTRENLIRFAEGALGVILVSVAVVRLTEGSKFAQSAPVKILKKVPFA